MSSTEADDDGVTRGMIARYRAKDAQTDGQERVVSIPNSAPGHEGMGALVSISVESRPFVVRNEATDCR